MKGTVGAFDYISIKRKPRNLLYTEKQLPYIPDYKMRFFAKFKASKSKGRLIHRE